MSSSRSFECFWGEENVWEPSNGEGATFNSSCSPLELFGLLSQWYKALVIQWILWLQNPSRTWSRYLDASSLEQECAAQWKSWKPSTATRESARSKNKQINWPIGLNEAHKWLKMRVVVVWLRERSSESKRGAFFVSHNQQSTTIRLMKTLGSGLCFTITTSDTEAPFWATITLDLVHLRPVFDRLLRSFNLNRATNTTTTIDQFELAPKKPKLVLHSILAL